MIALLSNITIESLAEAVSKTTGEEIYTSPGYNTWLQDLLTADFGSTKPEVVFVILDGGQLFGDLFPAEWEQTKQAMDEILSVISNFTAAHKDIYVPADFDTKRKSPLRRKCTEKGLK